MSSTHQSPNVAHQLFSTFLNSLLKRITKTTQIISFLVAKTHQKKTVQFSSNFLKKVGHAVHDAVTGCPKNKLDSWEDHGSMIVVLQAAAGLEEDHAVRFVGGRLNQRLAMSLEFCSCCNVKSFQSPFLTIAGFFHLICNS